MQRPLEERVFKNETFVIPKKIIREIILHKHCRAFEVYLQFKPLYVSSVIMNDGGKLPYRMMAAFMGISVSGLRGKIRQLKKHKLIWVDKKKNIHLASYKTFINIFKPQFFRRMKKFIYKNVASADVLIKTAAIQDNFSKQEYIIKNKIINKEIHTVNAQKDRINSPKGFFPLMKTDCPRTILSTDLSKSAIRKVKKSLLKDYDNLLHKYKRMYLEQLEQVQNGFPEINPTVTLSCSGVGRLFGVGATTGHYQRNKLAKAGVISIKSGDPPLKIWPVSLQDQQELRREGVNVFSFNYPVKRCRGKEEKFFLRFPDKLTVNSLFIYENAKN
jgi:hypothetical protein